MLSATDFRADCEACEILFLRKKVYNIQTPQVHTRSHLVRVRSHGECDVALSSASRPFPALSRLSARSPSGFSRKGGSRGRVVRQKNDVVYSFRRETPPPLESGFGEGERLGAAGAMSSVMSEASFEEARWNRVLFQSACGVGAYVTLLVGTRVWTSFNFTRFQKRRHKSKLDTFVTLLDIVCSVGSCANFIAYASVREFNWTISVFELCFALVYFLATYRRLWLKQFDLSAPVYPFHLSTFLDAYSVAIAVHQVSSGRPTWLAPTYVRVVSALIRYEELLETGLLTDLVGEVRQRLVLSVLRFVCVTFLFTCGGFTLEMLGDFRIYPGAETWAGTIVEVEPAHDMTLFEQFYFVVVTLSTVGYGDFSPSTVLHRLFVIAMIITGVAFFSSEISAIIAMRNEIDSGMGQYRRSRFRNYHILVLGGAVTSGSATLQIFLEELLHPSRPSAQLPDVVLMSEEEPGPGLRRILTSPLGVLHVKFIRGSPMDQTALDRADATHADMGFILGNLSVLDSESHAEDEDTILRASLLQRQLPNLPIRLLLLRSWAQEMAKTAGINPLCCLTSGVLNFSRTAMAVRCPGSPVLLTTMYSKLAGDWSQLPDKMMPWVREYFSSMRHDVYGAQVGGRYDDVSFLEAAADIYKKHNVTLLAVQTGAYSGARLLPGGFIDGNLHVLSEGDVVFALGHDARSVLRAVGSTSRDPNSWRHRFHQVRRLAARHGRGRAEVFSPRIQQSISGVNFSPRPAEALALHNIALSCASKKHLTGERLDEITEGGTDEESPDDSARGEARANSNSLMRQTSKMKKSTIGSVSAKTRNLCALTTRLAAAEVLHDATVALQQKRAEGGEATGFTPWRIIQRVAKTGNHIVVMVDGDFDVERWSELSILLHRLRGNDGCNMKPIVVVSQCEPSVQELTIWRTIEAYVTQGSVADIGVAQKLGIARAAAIVMVADACTSNNPLLMDRRVLLGTSVLERSAGELEEDPMSPEVLMRKLVLELHYPKSVWHLQENIGFETLHEGKMRRHQTDDYFGYVRRQATANRLRKTPNRGSREQLQRSNSAPNLTFDTLLKSSAGSNFWSNFKRALAKPLKAAGWTLEKLVDTSQSNTVAGKACNAFLKFWGVLDEEGHPLERWYAKPRQRRDLFRTNANRKTWIERPESHTQYAGGRVMFRPEMSRLMATVFYTPGLMELIDTLTRDAAVDEDIGHHSRIWSIPVPEDLHGKSIGDAFERFAQSEALVIGVFRNAKNAQKAKSHGASFQAAMVAESEEQHQAQMRNKVRRAKMRQTSGGHLELNRLSDSDSDTSESDSGSEETGDRDGGDGEEMIGHHYVLTSPPPNISLNPSDSLYVIATTDWAWHNVAELIEQRRVSTVICLQRRFRARMDAKREVERSERLRQSLRMHNKDRA